MYVRFMIKGQQVAAMVDTGATHSFLEEWIVHRLDLKVDTYNSRIKVVNSQAQAVTSMAHSVKISMGAWEGKIDLMIVQLDDFDLILGSEFFIYEKIILIPHVCGLLVTNEQNPCFVVGYNDAMGWKRMTEMLSTMQVGIVAAISSVESELLFLENISRIT
ncbi:Asp_protease_2 domain-containing protein [Cephalotus follicularis]|uniref:Asp_protease_2 domain-containing protein n=1 Tax=Cephalotus follicularis TaxID=3775 RepID=A0A1Q3C5M9_CEPFO|nr:Asp_protease_2 domain-containing protein [Cephalotus follicularis]